MSLRYAATLFMLVITLVTLRTGVVHLVPLVRPLQSIPQEWNGFRGIDRTISDADLRILRPTSYLNRIYLRDKMEINLFVVYFASQDLGSMMHPPRACLPLAGWDVFDPEAASMRFQGQPVRINYLLLRNDSQRLFARYWYQNPQRIVADEFAVKFYLAVDRLIRHSTAGTFVRVTVGDAADQGKLLTSFAEWVAPQVQACLAR